MNLVFGVSNAGEITPFEAIDPSKLEQDSPDPHWEEFHIGEYRTWLRGGLRYQMNCITR